jgi:hypothetical protein
MNQRYTRDAALFFGILVAAVPWMCGCSDEEFDGSIVPAWSEAKLAAIPDTLRYDSFELVIDASLNRDFMPIAPSDGRPMSAEIHLRAVSGVMVPDVIRDPTLYVVHGRLMWVAGLTARPIRDDRPFERVFNAGSGPKWGPGEKVDAVMGFTDDEGMDHLVIARDVLITESD